MFSDALIAHIIGDWLINTKALKRRKRESDVFLFLHVLITSLPFLLMGFNSLQILLFAISHLLIDGLHLGLLWSRHIGGDDEILFPQYMDDQAFHIISIWAILQIT